MSNNKRSEPSMVHGAIPYLISSDAQKHMEWMKEVFLAEVTSIHWTDAEGSPLMKETKDAKPEEGWQVMHAEVLINNGPVYLSDHIQSSGYPELAVTPAEVPEGKGRGVMFHLDLGDKVDEVWQRALKAKARVRVDLAVQFWGAKYGVFVDPFGYEWSVSKSESSEKNGKKAKESKEDANGRSSGQ